MSDGQQNPAQTAGLGQGVGIVVVSHSRGLARAAVALASEMLHGRPVKIAVAAGLDDTTFGTDAVCIKEAIERVDGPEGVVVLMDLGSAVLSAELALDLLDDPTTRDRVILSPAPIVEGLIVAVVAAAGGAGRVEVAAEAGEALLGKAANLTDVAEPEPVETVPAEAGPDVAGAGDAGQIGARGIVGVFSVSNPHGLHARPAARLVSELSGLTASVELRNLTTGAGPVPANSLSRVATLAALRGHEVEVQASGPQAQQAVDQLIALAQRRFDESTDPAESDPPMITESPLAAVARIGPLPASPGIAIGPARKLTSVPVELDQYDVGEPAVEWRRVVESIADVRAEIESVREITTREVGSEEAAIFDAHLSLLVDPELLADVERRIGTGVGAVGAWAGSIADVEQHWAGLPDPYLRERAEDVHAVGQQVLRALTGTATQQMMGEGVLVARDLTPAEAAGLQADLVTGVILADGSPSSHAAILARARDIPVVVSAGPEVLSVLEETPVAIDGGTGELHINPSPQVIEEFQARARERASRQARDLALAEQPAVSRDGTKFVVAANLGSVADAKSALTAGADAAGLVRTEFLFLGRDAAPGIDEQLAEYESIADAMSGRRVTLRTLDVGGDKPLAYLPMPREENPFLGHRGIRLSLDHRDLLHDQLVAICRIARRSPTSVMFPMVSTSSELADARQILADAAGTAGLPSDLQVGMMVEVPAAALKIESFLPYLDFVSIGTNDLTQYALAAERGNGAVAAIFDALDPGVLQLIQHVCDAPRGRVKLSVCGEAASDELAIPVLIGLGVNELSVSPVAVPGVKAQIRELDLERCRALARQALTLAGPDEVRKLVLAAVTDWS
jgi:phosphoenolpyruvate-protein phosphotransferase/dihydroxyacetone kinase phosphotransfer subunit